MRISNHVNSIISIVHARNITPRLVRIVYRYERRRAMEMRCGAAQSSAVAAGPGDEIVED